MNGEILRMKLKKLENKCSSINNDSKIRKIGTVTILNVKTVTREQVILLLFHLKTLLYNTKIAFNMKCMLIDTSCVIHKTKKTVILVLLSFLLTNIVSSQCLTAGDIGDFESNVLSDNWWTGTQSNGTIALDAIQAQSGSKSVKVEVTAASTWQVRLYNQNCTFSIATGESYRVTIYAKGTVGTTLDIALLDNATAQSNQNVTLTSTG